MKTLALAAVAAVTLTACAGIDDAMQYADIRPVAFQHGGKTFRVYDMPAEGRLMITPSLADSFAAGATAGLTFGLVDARTPPADFTAAANAWVTRHGDCTVTGGRELIIHQWEYTYEC